MNELFQRWLCCTLICLLPGCAGKPGLQAVYDFGPLPEVAQAAAPALTSAMSIADVRAPAWLDSGLMYYRLLYLNPQQPQPYAGSRWAMPPAQLFGQRLKMRISQNGGVVLDAGAGAANMPTLHIDLDEFIQNFEQPGRSRVQLSLRASLFNGHALLTQKTFRRQLNAPGADAAGGAQALAAASDALIDDLTDWLTTRK